MRRRWALSQNTTGGESALPNDSSGEPALGPTDARPQPAAPSGPEAAPRGPEVRRTGPQAPPPRLAEQVRRTVDAARRLAATHVALARTELSEIVERAKAAAIFVGLAIALLLFAAILASVGTTLFIGEWLFGSLGWGVLHGVLLCVALVAALLLAALEIPGRHLASAFVGAVGIGIVVAVVLGLAWPNQAFTRIGDALIPGIETGVRPLVAGLGVGTLLVGLVALVIGARAGGPGGAIAGLVGGAVVGALAGAFLAISFSRHVGIAIGICAVLIAWPALVATALRGYDWGALKARYWPGTTIETTKETIEWVRARTPLGRKP